jgi:uncharacterized membrane protein YhaH (DUF805 family)
MARMESPAAIRQPLRRLAPLPFALAIVTVYFVSFLSQVLLAAPVMAYASVFPFLLVQVATTSTWYVLHVRRLNDADRNTGVALAITILYALGIVLLLLIMTLLAGIAPAKAPDVDPPAAGVPELILLLYLVGVLTGDPGLGVFGTVMLGALALIVAPMLISVGFSLWVATRPHQPPPA